MLKTANATLSAAKGDYRPDIDGLRAVSVLAVVFYHFQVPPFSGGFVGVDVFFVISGFLITSHLLRDLDDKRFSLLSFYDRRFRRIIPALVPVLLLSLIFGYVLLLPGDYEAFARSGIYSAFGAGNIFFRWNTEYFHQAAEFMPLLHMWSLGVEEQFYLVWPLVLAAVAYLTRNSRTAIAILLTLIIIGSFTSSLLTFEVDASAAFYRPDTRAWELALGAILPILPRMKDRWLAEAASTLGMALIFVGIFTLDNESPFPGWNALYPAVGATLVVWPKTETTAIAKTLGWRPAVFIGLISYSLYLWHWPVLVFFRIYNNGFFPTPAEAAALIALAVACAVASYYLVEQPGRRVRFNRIITVAAAAAAMAVVATVSMAVANTRGFPNRLSADQLAMADLQAMWNWPACPEATIPDLTRSVCRFGRDWESAPKKVFMWGDSHAAHLAPALNSIMKEQAAAGMLYRACPATYGGNVHRYLPNRPYQVEECRKSYKEAVAYLRAHPEIGYVVLAGFWTEQSRRLYTTDPTQRSKARGEALLTQGLEELAAEIGSPSRVIVVVGPFPVWNSPKPIECFITSWGALARRKCTPEQSTLSAREFATRSASEASALQKAARLIPGARFIDPFKAMCDDSACVTHLNDEFLYRDRSHIRRNLKPETLRLLAERMHLNDALN